MLDHFQPVRVDIADEWINRVFLAQPHHISQNVQAIRPFLNQIAYDKKNIVL